MIHHAIPRCTHMEGHDAIDEPMDATRGDSGMLLHRHHQMQPRSTIHAISNVCVAVPTPLYALAHLENPNIMARNIYTNGGMT